MPKVKRLDKMPKRKVTVDDLLDTIDTTEIISNLSEWKQDIDEVLVVFTKRDENFISWRTNGMSIERQVYFLECIKYALLNKEE